MLLRDGAIYIASRVFPGLLGFATAIVLTWMLPGEDYGLYGLGMATIMLGNAVLFEWLTHGVIRWYESSREDPRFLPTVVALFAAVCLASALPVAAASALGLTGKHPGLWWILLLGIWAHGWFELSARIHVCNLAPLRCLGMNLARGVLLLGGAALLAWATRSGEAVLLGVFGAILLAALAFPAVAPGSGALRRPLARFDPGLARALLTYGAPLVPSMLLGTLMTSANPLLIGALAGKEEVGAFTISFTLVQNTLMVIAYGISSAIWPLAVRAVDSGDPALARAQLGRNWTFLFGALLPAAVGLALLAPGIARLLVSPAFHDAILGATPWLCVCALLMTLRSVYVDAAFQFARRTGLMLQVTAVGALVNLVLALLLIPRHGHMGAVYAMTAGFGVALVHASVLAMRCHPLPVPWRETLAIVLATGAMAGVVAAVPAAVDVLGLLTAVAAGGLTYGAVVLVLAWAGLMPAVWPAAVRIMQAVARRLGLRGALVSPPAAARPPGAGGG